MEAHQDVQNHSVVMKNRSFVQLSGVADVVSFDAVEIILETVQGMLMIKGNQLHMSQLSLEKGEVCVDGTVDSLTYSDSHKSSKQAKKLMGRLFR